MTGHGLSPLVTLVLAAALAAVACGGGHADHAHHSLPAWLEQATVPPADTGLRADVRLDAAVAVEGYPGVPTFFVERRSDRMEQAPCVSCHTQPLDRTGAAEDAAARAHWHISLAHAGEAVMACATCHASNDLSHLRTITGRPVAFDHSYQVCAQCHSGQAADWAGGAHGKRIGGWAPPRVVSACTSCHDPHQPAWTPRWPAHVIRSEQADGRVP